MCSRSSPTRASNTFTATTRFTLKRPSRVPRKTVAPLPTAFYGFVMTMAGTAYYILKTAIIRSQGAGSPLQAALGSDTKGKLSVMIYLVAMLVAFMQPWIATALYVAVALIWLVPDPRIERRMQEHV